MATDRALALWMLADCLREFRRRRFYWQMHGNGPTPEESMAEWWARMPVE